MLAFTVVALAVLGLFIFLPFGNEHHDDLERIHSGSRIWAVRGLSSQNTEQNNMVKVNNIQRGENIKERLDKDPSIRLIYHNKKNKSHYYQNQATVKFSRHPSPEQMDRIEEQINGKVLKELDQTHIFKSQDKTTAELLHYFRSLENVVYSEPNFILLQNEINAPNDSLYREKYQWNLPLIEAELGWNITRGSEDITIAVVDTGVDLDHPDLRNRLVKGYNVVDDNNNPDDDNGHGSHVAGIIASETNNREGTAGVTWFNKIMPVKVMGPEGYGTTFDIAKGIIWAADNGADVINLSLGNYQPSVLLEEAVQYAYSKNAVIVAAAGNDSSNQPTYPASYPEVLSVSAVSIDGSRAPFSNYGDYIDIAAPGEYILSTFFDKQYAALSGTSMAAPHAAGLAGLMLSANPELSNKEVMDKIKSSAIDLGSKGKDHDFGYGLIDIKTSLQSASKPETPINRFRDRFFKLWQ